MMILIMTIIIITTARTIIVLPLTLIKILIKKWIMQYTNL
jgi:hypothetical protein